MKKLIITASQVGAIGTRDVNNSVTFAASVNTDNFNKVAGTALNELFAWVAVQKEMGAHGLSLSLPIDLRFQSETEDGDTETIFDTTRAINSGDIIALKILRQRMKLQNSAKGKRNFARKFMSLFTYATRSIEERDINGLIAEFDELARYEDALKGKVRKEVAAVTAAVEGWRLN